MAVYRLMVIDFEQQDVQIIYSLIEESFFLLFLYEAWHFSLILIILAFSIIKLVFINMSLTLL